MNDFPPPGAFGRRHQGFSPPPNYSTDTEANNAVQPNAAASNTAIQGPLQDDAAGLQAGAAVVQLKAANDNPPPETPKKFNVPVEQIQRRLEENGISKSKDTIQRYCRDGFILEWDKLGLMRRYFATEQSVTKLIEKLTEDASAQDRTQPHAAATEDAPRRIKVHAAADVKNAAENKDPRAAAETSTQVHKPAQGQDTNLHAAARSSEPGSADVIFDHPYVKRLEGQVASLEVKYDKHVERTEEIQKGHSKELASLHQQLMVASSKQYAEAYVELARGNVNVNSETEEPTASIFGGGDNQQV